MKTLFYFDAGVRSLPAAGGLNLLGYLSVIEISKYKIY